MSAGEDDPALIGLRACARALERLGNADAGTAMGAVENLALEIKNAGEEISAAIRELAAAVREAAGK